MIKEIKYLLYLLVIFLFIFFSVRFYVSNDNKKNYFRSISQIDEKIKINEQNIVILTSDTEDIIEYVDLNKNNKKDEFKFFELLQKN
tara:strand:+ start:867 stop:1127 length:261 start_codon:yes stop_codon:yes gene_type:complete